MSDLRLDAEALYRELLRGVPALRGSQGRLDRAALGRGSRTLTAGVVIPAHIRHGDGLAGGVQTGVSRGSGAIEPPRS